MEREMDEILESQATMLDHLGKARPKGDVSCGYLQQVHAAKTSINGHGIPAMSRGPGHRARVGKSGGPEGPVHALVQKLHGCRICIPTA